MYQIPLRCERYIALQRTPIVKSSDKNSPIGIFSPNIFGVTENERIRKFAFINLNCYVMRPWLLDIMKRIDSKIYNCCISSANNYVIEKGVIRVATDSDVNSEETPVGYGPEFLYFNWEKIDKKRYVTTTGKYSNNEMKNILVKLVRDDCFTHYQYVEAIAYRDEMGDSAILSNDENIIYADIIRFSNIIEMGGLTKHRLDIILKIQQKVQELFDYVSNQDVGPHGNFRENILAKAVDDSSRMTILPVIYKSRKLGKSKMGMEGIGVPIQHLVANFRDFVVKYSKDFIENLHDNDYFGYTNRNRVEAFYDKDYLEDKIAKMDDPYFRVSPFEKVNADGTISNMILDFNVYNEETKQMETIQKPLYWIEFFYIVLIRYINVYETKALWVVRYPVDSMLSAQPLKPVTLTLNHRYTKTVEFLGYEYEDFPFVTDWIVEHYQEKIFENGSRVSSATAVGFNGKQLPFHIVICDRNFIKSWKSLKLLCH